MQFYSIDIEKISICQYDFMFCLDKTLFTTLVFIETCSEKNQVQKLGSTMNRTGLQYSPSLNEFIVRELVVLKSQTSVGTGSLKIIHLKVFLLKYLDFWPLEILDRT